MTECSSLAPEPSPPPTRSPVCCSGSKLSITVSTIGAIAREKLAHAGQASVIGKTSRGLFLHLASDWVIFLSFESYHGPLTLNLVGEAQTLASLETGAPVHCSAEHISFPSIRLALPLAGAASWRAALPAGESPPPEPLRGSLFSTLRLAVRKNPDHRLLTTLSATMSVTTVSIAGEPDFHLLLRRLHTACRGSETEAISTALAGFLGLGPGLTPSGDDLVMGFLLAISRWGQRLTRVHEISAYSQQLLPGLHRRTSHLSASLIACACRGQADERLIYTLDGLVTGSPEAGAYLASLSTWGSSSGLDALAGMLIFFLDCQS